MIYSHNSTTSSDPVVSDASSGRSSPANSYFAPEVGSRNQLDDIGRSYSQVASDDTDNESVDGDEMYTPPAVALASTVSWYINWLLLFIKLYCYVISSSKAVAAALADSVVDILSQLILMLADIYINEHSTDYPVGRSRLEALSVLGCAGLMIVASVEVVQGEFGCIQCGIIMLRNTVPVPCRYLW